MFACSRSSFHQRARSFRRNIEGDPSPRLGSPFSAIDAINRARSGSRYVQFVEILLDLLAVGVAPGTFPVHPPRPVRRSRRPGFSVPSKLSDVMAPNKGSCLWVMSCQPSMSATTSSVLPFLLLHRGRSRGFDHVQMQKGWMPNSGPPTLRTSNPLKIELPNQPPDATRVRLH